MVYKSRKKKKNNDIEPSYSDSERNESVVSKKKPIRGKDKPPSKKTLKRKPHKQKRSKPIDDNSDDETVEYEDGEQLHNETTDKESAKNKVKSNDIFKLIDLYYSQQNVLFRPQIESFDYLMDTVIPNIFMKSDNIIHEKIEKNTKYVHYLKFSDIQVKPPIIDSSDTAMFPDDARQKNMTYSAKVYATVSQFMDTIDIATGNKKTEQVGETEKMIQPANIPVMLRSKYCNLNHNRQDERAQKESPLDPGCYFIVNGNEKVVISLESMIENKHLVFKKQDASGVIYTCQVISKKRTNAMESQTISIRLQNNGKCMIKLPMFNEFPVYVLLRALGLETDKDIINHIVRDGNDKDLMNFVRLSMDKSRDDSKEKGKLSSIYTAIDAKNYLLTKLKYIKRYSDTDLEIQNKQKNLHLEHILEGILPHVRGGKWNKAYFLTLMMNKLMNCAKGRIKPDDRDSFFNKRVKLTGPLIEELIRQKYATLLNECSKHLRGKLGNNNEPVSVINQIKPSTIEQGIKKALSTGSWGSKTKKGVAEVLQRLTFLQTISYFRRLKSPTADASTNKLTGPRHLHNTQAFLCCPGETPEGANTGMVKNLALSCSVTNPVPTQDEIILDILDKSKKILDKRILFTPLINKYTTVFLNYDPIGFTNNSDDIYNELRSARTNGIIDKYISISNNVKSKEIHIWTDGGRLVRPLLRVGENNELLLKKEHLDEISLIGIKDPKSNLITTWDDFLIKYPELIEFVDVEEIDNYMVAMYPEMVYEQKKRMNYIPTEKDIKTANINRYNLSYVTYTHCELHPSLLLGMVTSNTPFAPHNQSPRIVYQYSQARQAMGIYTTNYLNRMDLSYNLYYPERPLLVTKGMSYTRMIELPAGFNAIVAIMTYGGYNIDDSIIINQSAIDRGFARGVSYKKYSVELKKNAATSSDDIFRKPKRDDTTDMGDWNFDLLNDAGWVPEETEVISKDAVIAKLSPIPQQGEEGKKLRNNSEVYKYNTPGVIDKIYPNLKNADNYPMIKMKIRSRRIVQIADKFCSRMAQKGTCGITWAQHDMPWSVDSGLVPDMIVNTNAFPKRMTIGQQIEVVAEKVAALQGGYIDGTPFPYDYYDTTSIFDYLKSKGFNEYGLETMYCGMSGRRFQARIFVGPTYYLRLKHLVADKIHSRAYGPKSSMTRQPLEGRFGLRAYIKVYASHCTGGNAN